MFMSKVAQIGLICLALPGCLDNGIQLEERPSAHPLTLTITHRANPTPRVNARVVIEWQLNDPSATLDVYYDFDAKDVDGVRISVDLDGSLDATDWIIPAELSGRSVYLYGIARHNNQSVVAYSTSPVAIEALHLDASVTVTPSAETILRPGWVDFTWQVIDPNQIATLLIFVDDNQFGFDGTPLSALIEPTYQIDNSATGSVRWNDPPVGRYFYYTLFNNGRDPPVATYSTDPITVVSPTTRSNVVSSNGAFSLGYSEFWSNLVIASIDQSELRLWSHGGGDLWAYYSIDSVGLLDNNYETVFASKADGSVVVAYQNTVDQALGRHGLKIASASKTYQDWTSEVIDDQGDSGYDPSIAIDSIGRPTVVYADLDEQTLYYAWKNGNRWVNDLVAEFSGWGEGTSLAFTELGEPTIAYSAGAPESKLFYASRDSHGSWTIEGLDATHVAVGVQHVVDTSGHPWICWHDYQLGELRVAHHDGVGWDYQMVDLGQGCSIKVDSSGFPWISYLDPSENQLKIARFDGRQWHIAIGTALGSVGSTSLAMPSDPALPPSITVFDSASFSLRLTSWELATAPDFPSQQ